MGFPSSWENFLHFVFGIILVFLSISVSVRYRERRTGSNRRAAPTRREDEIPMFVDVQPRVKKETKVQMDSTDIVEKNIQNTSEHEVK